MDTWTLQPEASLQKITANVLLKAVCVCVRFRHSRGGVASFLPSRRHPQNGSNLRKVHLYRAEKERRRGGTMGEIKSRVLVISDINGKCSPKKVFIRGGVWMCVWWRGGGVGLRL